MDGAEEQFDILIGSEVIYEEEHAQWIASCLSTFIKPGGVVYMIASTRPERPGWVALKDIIPQLCGGEFQLEVVPVQGGMPRELHQDIAEETDYLHEMLSGRRRTSTSVVGREGEEPSELPQLCSSYDFPTVTQTVVSLQTERSEARVVHASDAVENFLSSMPTIT